MSALTEKAMLVRLSVSQWTARKYDRKVSRKVEKDYKASTDAGRYNKLLVAEAAIKAVQQVVNETRTYHYENTLPWGNDESRLLPAVHYFDYTQEMRGYKAQFEKAVDEFVAAYPSLIEDARTRLGKMFNEADYPKAAQVRGLFDFSTQFSPLPDAGDFRVDLSSEETAKIQADIEARGKAAQTEAMNDLWQRLYGVVKHMATKLGDDGIFRDTLVTNISDLVQLLPKLNIGDDADLEAMRRDVEARLLAYSPQTLRENDAARVEAAKEADEIMKKMAGYMGVAE